MRAPRKLPNLANLMMQVALQRLALPLITGTEWAIFQMPINQLLSATIDLSSGPSSIYKRPGDLVA
jgi:hypothetical protein